MLLGPTRHANKSCSSLFMPDRILVGARNLYHISKAGCFHALLASCQLKPSQQKKMKKNRESN
jgi:hypothetical protein